MNRVIIILFIALINNPAVVLSQSVSNTVTGREEFDKGHNLFVLEEFKQAEEWFKKAIAKGHTLSMTYLGSMYQNAMNKPGLTRDYNEALKWYKMAAEKGEYMAMRSLSNMYAYGYGVPIDVTVSKHWREKADAAKAVEDTRLAQAKATTSPKSLPAQSSAMPSDSAKQLLNQGVAAYNSKSSTEAMKLFRASAGMGQTEAMFNIGAMYYQGEGVSQDFKQAFGWFQKAADAGLVNGMYNLGIMYQKGEGIKQDNELAKIWYKKAADNGHANAKLAYGKLDSKLPNEHKGGGNEQLSANNTDIGLRSKAPSSMLKPIVNTLVPYLGKSGKYGLADRNGKVIVAPKFDFSPRIMDDGLIYISENRKYGVLDGQGRTLIEAKYNVFSDFSEGLARVRINDYSSGSLVYREAFIDKNAKVIIQGSPDITLDGDFSDERAVIIGRAGIGFIDRTGKVVIKPKYQTNLFGNYANIFTGGVARVVRADNRFALINTSGKELTTKPYEDISGNTSFIESGAWEGIFIYKLNAGYGFLDKSGKEITPAEYSYAAPFKEGMGRFARNEKYGFIDRNGKLVIPANYIAARDFKNGMAPVKVDNKWGFIDKTGKLVIPARFDDVADFSEDVAAVKLNNRYVYIDKQGRFVIDPGVVEYAGPYSEGLAPVRKNGQYGFIDKTGNMKIQAKYFNIGFNAFDNGIMNIEVSQGKWLSIDRNGKEFKE